MKTIHLRDALWAMVGCSVVFAACGQDPTTSTHPRSYTGDQDQPSGGDAAVEVTRALVVNRTGQGTGTVTGGGISCGTSCSTSVAHGTVVSLSAAPSAGSTMAGFSGCDSATATTCTVTMTRDRNVIATFDLAETTLTVARSGTGDGTVTGGGISCGTTCSAEANRNSSVTLTASPGACTELESWSGCDSTSGPTCTVTMDTDRAVTATFTRVGCALTVHATGTGTGLVTGGGIDCGSTCSTSVPYGTVVTLAATPGACSSFNGWDGCDSIAGDSCNVTMDDDRAVDSVFTRFPVICSAGETRCVAGDITAVQTCDVCGATWVQGGCSGDYSLCSDSACRPVCGITTKPTYPTLCVSPNADGVNDGLWLTWSDWRLGVPTYATASVRSNSSTAAPIYSASGQAWPYAWSYGTTGYAAIAFKLNQFTAGRTVYVSFRAKRANVISSWTNRYSVAFYNGSAIVDSGAFGPVPSTYQEAWAASNVANLNYSGGWNTVYASIVGDGYGHAVDLMDLNWILLQVR